MQWSNLSGNNGYSSYLTEGGVLWRTVRANSIAPPDAGSAARAKNRVGRHPAFRLHRQRCQPSLAPRHLPDAQRQRDFDCVRKENRRPSAGRRRDRQRRTLDGKTPRAQAHRPQHRRNRLAMEPLVSPRAEPLPGKSQLPNLHRQPPGTPQHQLPKQRQHD